MQSCFLLLHGIRVVEVVLAVALESSAKRKRRFESGGVTLPSAETLHNQTKKHRAKCRDKLTGWDTRRDKFTSSWEETSWTATGNHRHYQSYMHMSAKQLCALPLHKRRNGGGDGAVACLHRVNAVARHAAVEMGVGEYLKMKYVNARMIPWTK